MKLKFNKGFFLVGIGIILPLTIFSLLAAAAQDEGTLGEGLIRSILADAFYVFRFPTHTLLFWLIDIQFVDHMNSYYFFIGLIINVILYAFLIERVLSYFSKTQK